jgi:hypothetical protein
MPIGEELGLGATLIAGPSITAYDNGTFRIPITLGLHANYVMLTANAENPMTWVWNIGAGAVNDFVWQFGEKWYAYGRIQIVCNFGALEFLASPGLGAGIRR